MDMATDMGRADKNKYSRLKERLQNTVFYKVEQISLIDFFSDFELQRA